MGEDETAAVCMWQNVYLIKHVKMRVRVNGNMVTEVSAVQYSTKLTVPGRTIGANW